MAFLKAWWHIPHEGAHTPSSSLLSYREHLLSYPHSCLLPFPQSSCFRVGRESCAPVKKAARPTVRPRSSLLPRGKHSPPLHVLLWEPLCTESLLLGHVASRQGASESRIDHHHVRELFPHKLIPRHQLHNGEAASFLPGPTFQSAVSTRSCTQDDGYVGCSS